MKPVPMKQDGHLVNAYFDLLVLGVHARDSRDLGRVESLQAKIDQMLEEADRRGTVMRYSRDILIETRYAIVAFLDEMILQSGWDQKSQWASQLLQYKYFQTQVAGEEFFHHLTTLRRALPVNPDLLEVFHACLVLGFEGQYKLEGREKLKDLKHDLFRDIQGLRGEIPPLSPHAERHEVVLDVVKHEIPAWVVLACSLAVAFFSYVGMSVMIHQEAETTFGHLSELVETSQP
ncbi:MAG: type IVB secretion system protein IcmH/DotU [Nitrospirota bacterium]|nr:type IVB secretion system protein IcmH/DotU [Nitrospirota bacterium]MDH5774996.1 type IVB secretion system protein IcmH/DotU [Nitrospirota bacterium]